MTSPSAANSKPTVLVTGAAGFIGSHVAEQALALGFRVVSTDDLSGGFVENVPAGSEWVQGDLRDATFVQNLFERYRFDYVYHLGAYAAEGLSHFIRRYNYQTNLVASVNLLNEAVKHEVKCFVFTSSIAVYGRNQLPMTEDAVPQPEDPYGISKYAFELDLKAAHELFGLNYIVFRPHNVYGERQNIADKYRNVIGIFMNQALQGKPMTIFGDGTQTRAFSHVDTVAPTIARSVNVPAAYNEVFNIGADQPYSVLDLSRAVAQALGVPHQVQHLPARNEVVHAFSTHAKLYRVFGPPRDVPLGDGLARMAAWVRRRGPMAPVEFAEYEVTKAMPPSWLKRS